jgi:Putative rhamnosyl transferase
MDKGLLKRRVGAPASRGSMLIHQHSSSNVNAKTTTSSDEERESADGIAQGGGGGGGGSSELLPLYSTTATSDGSDKKYKPMSNLRRRSSTTAGSRSKTLSSSNNSVWCTWGGFVTLLLMSVVCWILSLMLFSGSSSSSQRIAQQALHAVTGLRYYTPKLYSNAGDKNTDDTLHQKYKKEDFPWPMIHIVNTRFMQEQANLTFGALGLARLALFQVFCLPTMQHQTLQQFLWIIRVDPDLDTRLLKKLVRLVQPLSNNVYIVGSNHNFRINQDFPGAWRNGAQARDLAGLFDSNYSSSSDTTASTFPTRVYTGNQTLLEMAMALESQLPILETRLDADDGLHVQFIETLQKEAWEQAFSVQEKQPRLKWKYWCAQRNVEWHWSPPSLVPSAAKNNYNNKQRQRHGEENHDADASSLLYGKLMGVQHQAMCITAGITVGFPVGTDERQVPVFPHHELAWRIQHEELSSSSSSSSCGLANTSNCLEFLKVHPFEAVRSRTPTSHGMLDILLGGVVSSSTAKDGGPSTDDEQQQHHHHQVERRGEEEEHDDEVREEDTWLNYAYWDILNRRFRIQREQVRFVQEYLMDNLVEIAKDNLMGQCTTGHSCKPEAKRALETIIATYSNENIHPPS